MKKILITIGIALCLNTKAQTWVTIPDAAFVTYLQGLIPAAMSGNQLDTTNTLVTTTTHSINCSGLWPVTTVNIFGVQYFKSLTHLICSGNKLITLPALPNSITYLDCDNSQLFSFTNLPTSLTTLICNDNEISNLPTLPNSLTYLNCKSFNNNATLLSFPNFPNSLTWLDCSYNEIKCFPTFPNSITSLNINFNNYNCLPNYISAMGSDTVTYPLCAAGNSNGCAVTAGIEQYSANTNISIYPNPSNGSFVIEPNSTTKQTMQVYDVNGKMVLSQTINGKTTIDATPLNEGVYNISLLSNEGMVNKRVVIVR